MPAKFIVVEGLEGAGKSTAISTILSQLAKHDITEVVHTREPGGTVLAEKMRSLIKDDHDGEELQDVTELLLIYAARVQLVETVIKPALKQGNWVLGDRHDLSSLAYQGGGRRLDLRMLNNLRQITLGNFKPDFTLYLDIEPGLGIERARGRGELDRIERMDLSFFERARATYLENVKNDPSMVSINANQSLEKVTADIKVAVNQWLSSIGKTAIAKDGLKSLPQENA